MKAEKFLTALLLATGAAVYATFTDGGAGAMTPIELSRFAAGLLKAALAVGLFWAFDRYVLDEVDTVAELRAGNVAYALALLALAMLLAATVATAQPTTAEAAGAASACARASRPASVSAPRRAGPLVHARPTSTRRWPTSGPSSGAVPTGGRVLALGGARAGGPVVRRLRELRARCGGRPGPARRTPAGGPVGAGGPVHHGAEHPGERGAPGREAGATRSRRGLASGERAVRARGVRSGLGRGGRRDGRGEHVVGPGRQPA